MQVMDGEPVLIGTHDVGGMARDYFLKRLATVVGNLDGLTRGEHKYDYTIRVPASRLHDVTQEIARLQLDTEERFGVTVSALAAPIPG